MHSNYKHTSTALHHYIDTSRRHIGPIHIHRITHVGNCAVGVRQTVFCRVIEIPPVLQCDGRLAPRKGQTRRALRLGWALLGWAQRPQCS